MRISFAIVAALVASCGKGDKAKPEPGSAATSVKEPAKPDPTPPAKAGGSKFAYPPSGPGPHDGFDLAALHKKLQGAWLIGGGAFSSIPAVWSLDGDALTLVGEDGKKTTETLRLLSPCYYVHGAADGASGTYSVFAFDGDTLYAGLGSAGLVQGDRTIACVASGIYVLDKSGCTRWTRKSFAKPGAGEWDKEPGDCKYSDDKATFSTDDTNSSHKTYGVETLKVKGNVLLTDQMANNKAEHLASLDAAIAKQKIAIDAQTALSQTPKDLPFKAWGLDATAPTYAANAQVWAAAVSRDGHWQVGSGRFNKFEDGAVWISGMNDAWAPPPFVHAPAAPEAIIAGGAAWLGIGALMPYGRIAKKDGDKWVVQFHSGPKVAEQTLEAARIWPLAKGAWAFGAPVMQKSGESWNTAKLVLEAGDDAYVYDGKTVAKVAKADLRLVDLARRFAAGQKAMAVIGGGMSGYKLSPVTVDKVAGDGVFYTVKADGKTYDVNPDQIIEKI